MSGNNSHFKEYDYTSEQSNNQMFIYRMPTYPVVELVGHEGALNGIAWAPHSSNHICTCGEDQQVLIWDIVQKTGR